MNLDFIDELGATKYIVEEACRSNLNLTWEEAQKVGEKIIKDFVDNDCDIRLIEEAIYSLFPSKYYQIF